MIFPGRSCRRRPAAATSRSRTGGRRSPTAGSPPRFPARGNCVSSVLTAASCCPRPRRTSPGRRRAGTPRPAAARTTSRCCSTPGTGSASTGSASTSTAGSTRRAPSSSWSSATPRSASRSSSRTSGTACSGTTRGSAASSWASRSRGGCPSPPGSGTTGSPLPTIPRTCSASTGRRPGARRCSRSGLPGSGSASSATRPRTSCSASRVSTSGAGCRCRSSWPTTSTGPARVSGSSTRRSGPTPGRWSRNWTGSA